MYISETNKCMYQYVYVIDNWVSTWGLLIKTPFIL